MNNTQPIFQSIFGQQWETFPPVMKMRYANRPFSKDIVLVEGKLNIWFSKMMAFLLPVLRCLKVLVPYQGNDIHVTVKLRSSADLPGLYFDRIFDFPDKQPYQFCSYMQPINNNKVVEFIRFGMGWCMKCSYDGKKILLQHHGYVWKIYGKIIPIPLSFIMGKIYSEEEALSDDTYRLLVKITHPLFGKIFEYSGELQIMGNE
jgi:hypothetical protein